MKNILFLLLLVFSIPSLVLGFLWRVQRVGFQAGKQAAHEVYEWL